MTATETKPATLTPEQKALSDALDQLNRSERGRRAAIAFRKFIEANNGSAASLDPDNWKAVASLARACRVFGAWSVRDFLPKR